MDRQILEEGYRNVIVKLTGVLTDSDIYETPAFSLQDAPSVPEGSVLVGYRVDLVEYSISAGLEVVLEWNSLNPQVILPLAGRGKVCATAYGGLHPDMTKLDYDGSLNLKTLGFSNIANAVATFTVMLELVKLYK
jgi:hypothetical protein